MKEQKTELKNYEVKTAEPKVNHEPETNRYVIDSNGCVISMRTYLENPRAYAWND